MSPLGNKKKNSPTFGIALASGAGGDVPEPEALWKIIDDVEDSSLDYLWVADHIKFHAPMYEATTLLAAIAARTTRIKFGTAVFLLAMRNPVVAAKTFASISRLSHGRFTLGVGIGGEFPPEWEAVGVNLKTRASRTDEMIEALRGLWEEGKFSYQGRRIRIPEIDLDPKPRERLPIWVGGRREGALRRAGRLADGWMGIFVTPDMFAAGVATMKEEAEKHGRDPSKLVPSLFAWTVMADTSREGRELAESIMPLVYNTPWERLGKYVTYGSAEDCAKRFKEFADAGAEHICVSSVGGTMDERLRRLLEEVAPQV